MGGTPFVAFLKPHRIKDYVLGAPKEDQPKGVDPIIVDAMEVRNLVFVGEQNISAENEFDKDDFRSCHWVAFASINKIIEEEVDESKNVIQPRRSSTRSTPIGTLRLVPFQHEPHPVPNGDYWNGVLVGTINADGSVTPAVLTGTYNVSVRSEVEGGEATVGKPSVPQPPNRRTSLHDGQEPYVKFGRLSVVKEFRGIGIAKLLVANGMAWLRKHNDYFNPSVAQLGLAAMGARTDKEIPQWDGLVCVHAQESVVGLWEKFGFQVDDGMGRWREEGIWHIGMFQRLEFTDK